MAPLAVSDVTNEISRNRTASWRTLVPVRAQNALGSFFFYLPLNLISKCKVAGLGLAVKLMICSLFVVKVLHNSL